MLSYIKIQVKTEWIIILTISFQIISYDTELCGVDPVEVRYLKISNGHSQGGNEPRGWAAGSVTYP